MTTSSSIQLPPFINSGEQTNYFDAFDPCNSLAKQYHSATNLLQNISASRQYFESTGIKYMDTNNNSAAKYFDGKYFSQAATDLLTNNKNATSTAGYPFVPVNVLQTGFPLPQNIIGSKSAFPQLPTGFPPLTTTSFSTLGSNSYPTPFNVPPYFNQKLGVSDSLNNNNYLYSGSLFNSKPAYSNAQGSTQIYPPYVNNNLFNSSMVHAPLIGSSAQETANNVSQYKISPLLPTGANSVQTVSTTNSIPGTPVGLQAPSMVVTSGVDPLSGNNC